MIATKVLARISPIHWYRDTYVRALRDIPSISNPSFQKLYENLYLDPTAAELRWKAISQFQDLTGEDVKVAGSLNSLTTLKDGDVDLVILNPTLHDSPSKVADTKAALELPEEYAYAASYILSGYHYKVRKESVHSPTQHPRITKGKIPVLIYKNRDNIQLDITVKNPAILETTAYVRDQISNWPPLKPVLLSLKAWFKHRDAGYTFTGGLGSYGLALTLIGYMKMRNPLYENADYRAQRRSDPGYDLIPTQKRDKWRIKKEGQWETLDSKGTFSPDGVAYDLGKLQDEKEETACLELDPKFLDPYEILLDYLKFWTTEWDLREWSLDVKQGRPVNKKHKFPNSEQRISILDPQSSNDVSALSTGILQILEGFKKLAEDLRAGIDPQDAFFPPKETLPMWDCADTLQKMVEANNAQKTSNGPRILWVDAETPGTRTKLAERADRKQKRPPQAVRPQEAPPPPPPPSPAVAESDLLPPSMTSKLLQLARARREAKGPDPAPASGLEQAAGERKQRAAQQKSAISADMEMLAGKET